ncbi:MAG: hypothetical protein HY513_05395 [Candidatus Aenigmarchaeota archaeon]|nr:hypothetical protein [Candidatus Aenigmarchaeota archaeon]
MSGKISAVYSDCDGVLAQHPLEQASRDTGFAREAGVLLSHYPSVKFSVVTGQAYSAAEDVLAALFYGGRTSDAHIFEMGYCIGQYGKIPALMPHLSLSDPTIASLNSLKQKLSLREHGHMSAVYKATVPKKDHMMSFVMTDGLNGPQFVKQTLQSLLEDNDGSEIAQDIKTGEIIIEEKPYAVDLLPRSVGKAQALVSTIGTIAHDEVLVIVDEGNQDLRMANALKGCRVACPLNADDDIKAFVRSLGDRGYQSPLNYNEGAAVDILKMAEKMWGFKE